MQRILYVLAVLLVTGGVHAQTRLGVAAADYALAQTWLSTNCFAPEAAALRDRLISRRAVMQQAFLAALSIGPATEEVAATRAAAGERWRRQREFIDRPEIREAIPAVQWEALRATTESAFAQAEVDNFVNGYRSNAMSGLAVVGDETAIDRLSELARKEGGPLAVAARGALAYRESLPTR